MKNIRLYFFFLVLGITLNSINSGCNQTAETKVLEATEVQDAATTFILVRHAEKELTGTADPNLTPAGQARAEKLQRMLSKVDLAAVYSTNFKRTKDTARPTADDKKLAISNYDHANLEGFIDRALVDYSAAKILVVGHSNSTPNFMNILVGQDRYPSIDEKEYDNLFIVRVFEKGRAEVIPMKFGD